VSRTLAFLDTPHGTALAFILISLSGLWLAIARWEASL
jgi:hypothetical protein